MSNRVTARRCCLPGSVCRIEAKACKAEAIRQMIALLTIERDVIARGVFASVPELKRNRKYNEQPKPVKWK